MSHIRENWDMFFHVRANCEIGQALHLDREREQNSRRERSRSLKPSPRVCDNANLHKDPGFQEIVLKHWRASLDRNGETCIPCTEESKDIEIALARRLGCSIAVEPFKDPDGRYKYHKNAKYLVVLRK